MEIIRMDKSHVADVATLEKLCFQDPWSEASVASEVGNPLSLWLVAIADGRVVGYVGSQSVLDGADMMNIAVAPAFRRQGVAEGLINRLIELLKSRGVICLSLEVRCSNDSAIGLYKKLGFSVIGKRPGYYRHPKEDALIMRKEFSA